MTHKHADDPTTGGHLVEQVVPQDARQRSLTASRLEEPHVPRRAVVDPQQAFSFMIGDVDAAREAIRDEVRDQALDVHLIAGQAGHQGRTCPKRVQGFPQRHDSYLMPRSR